MKQALVLTAAMFCGAGLVLPAMADGLKEGKWEYTTEMQFGGGMGMPQGQAMPKLPQGVQLPPGMKMPQFGPKGMTTTFQRCMTNDKPVPTDDKGPQKCEVKKMDRSGNTVKWVMHCAGKGGDMDGEGAATYTGDTMTSEMKMTGSHDGQPIDVTQKTTGKYLGACS